VVLAAALGFGPRPKYDRNSYIMCCGSGNRAGASRGGGAGVGVSCRWSAPWKSNTVRTCGRSCRTAWTRRPGLCRQRRRRVRAAEREVLRPMRRLALASRACRGAGHSRECGAFRGRPECAARMRGPCPGWLGRFHAQVTCYRSAPCRARCRALLDLLGLEPGQGNNRRSAKTASR
jgi:hypothetical protein